MNKRKSKPKKRAIKSRKPIQAAAVPTEPTGNYFELVKHDEKAPFFLTGKREDAISKANTVARTGSTVDVYFVGRQYIGFCTESFQLSPNAFSAFAPAAVSNEKEKA